MMRPSGVRSKKRIGQRLMTRSSAACRKLAARIATCAARETRTGPPSENQQPHTFMPSFHAHDADRHTHDTLWSLELFPHEHSPKQGCDIGGDNTEQNCTHEHEDVGAKNEEHEPDEEGEAVHEVVVLEPRVVRDAVPAAHRLVVHSHRHVLSEATTTKAVSDH